MPTYTVLGNNKTSVTTRSTAYANLAQLLQHAAGGMALNITAIAINGTSGAITITCTQTLSTADRAHLGLA
jgi:predicted amino acid dehydrogenase